MYNTKKRTPALLDEKDVTTDFIENEIFYGYGSTYRKQGHKHTYLGFFHGQPLMVEYSDRDNYLYCKFVGDHLDANVQYALEEVIMQYDDPEDAIVNGLRVTGEMSRDCEMFHFWLIEDEHGKDC